MKRIKLPPMSRPAMYVWFYVVHGFLLLWACVAYLFRFRPDYLDWWTWVVALAILLWTIYNSPGSSKILGHETVQSYRRWCLRRFPVFAAVSGALVVTLLAWGIFMFTELWSRWIYVDMVKQMTLEKGTDSIPFANPGDLAKAFNLYPHRREVPFVIGRMSRLLAFDDQTSNFNLYMAAFLKDVQVDRIIEKYRDKKILERYEGAIDPIVYIARLKVEAGGAHKPSLNDAIALLDRYRKGDGAAELYRLIYEEEATSLEEVPEDSKRPRLLGITQRMAKLLDEFQSLQSAGAHIQLVTSHVFQELLDHYAQLQIQIADERDPGKNVDSVVQLYKRVLTTRKQIANSSDVPWLEGPGKFTIYQYFAHEVGRETDVTREVTDLFALLPGLREALKKRIFDAEAFKEYHDLAAWERGTPLSSGFSGTAMYKKLTEWLKNGW